MPPGQRCGPRLAAAAQGAFVLRSQWTAELVDVTPGLAADLIGQQFPDLAARPTGSNSSKAGHGLRVSRI